MAAVMYSAVCAKCDTHTGYSHSPVDSGFICSPCILGKTKSLAPTSHKAASKTPKKPEPTAALVKDFTPAGRSGLYIYAVVIKQHPDKVKIGMTRKWNMRRHSYANWDLSPGDAIVDERVFCINEEFVDLERLEAHILRTFDATLSFGAEWFSSDIDAACRHIDRIMCANGISYSL